MSSQAGPIATPAGRRAPRRGASPGRQGWLFIAPAIVLLLVFLVYPVLWTIRLSLDTGRGLRFREFVGFDNYRRLFTVDRRFLDLSEFPPQGALVNNLRWLVIYTALSLAVGLAIAVLAVRVRYESVVKAIVFVPMAIAATAVAIIWLFVYSPDPDIGVLNAVLQGLDSDFDPVAWVGRESTVNYAIIFAYVWASTGFVMVVLSAALKGISAEILEAARVDGASEWAIFRRIQLPLLKLPMSVVTVWLMINVIKVFDVIYVMTRGGPNGASRVVAVTMYFETFEGGRGGYGAAVAVVMLLFIVPVMAFNVRRFRTESVVT